MTEKNIIKEGVSAPLFVLPDSDENVIQSKDFKGKWLILYFYPKDNTSGCTLEAVDFTREITFLKKHNVAVLGISPDSCKSHQKFILKHDLGITLLSDPEKVVLKQYGVWQLKKMYGREYYGVIRTTLLIDPKGIIVKIWNKVKVEGHVDEVKKTLLQLI